MTQIGLFSTQQFLVCIQNNSVNDYVTKSLLVCYVSYILSKTYELE